MTGLDYRTDRILEIAVNIMAQPCLTLTSCSQVLITNGNLDVVDDGLEFVIRTEKPVLDKFDTFL